MPGVRQAMEKLRGVRHIEWALLVGALAAVLLLVSGPQDGSGETRTGLEQRMEAVLSSIAGAGEVRVLVNQAETAFATSGAAVTGVLVVAEGAGDMRVMLELQQAVRALLGVETEQIEILTMKEDDP